MKSMTFKIDTQKDVEDLEDLLKELKYDVIMIDFTLDHNTNIQFLGVYTIAVPKNQTIYDVSARIYRNVHSEKKWCSLKKVYLTLKEGIYPNNEWTDEINNFLL